MFSYCITIEHSNRTVRLHTNYNSSIRSMRHLLVIIIDDLKVNKKGETVITLKGQCEII